VARRPPKDTTPISRSQPGKITFGGFLSGETTYNQFYLRDERPSYAYGIRGLIGKGRRWVHPTSYSHSSRTLTSGGDTFVATMGAYGRCTARNVNPNFDQAIGDSGLGPSFLGSANAPGGLLSKARTDALNKIANNKAGLGEDIATYAQTVKMFTSKGKLLTDLLHEVAKDKGLRKYLLKNFREIRKIDKHAANAYLEYVYGWKPLMADIHGVSELLKERASGDVPTVVYGTGKAYEEISGSKELQRDSYGGFEGNISRKGSWKVRCDIAAMLDPNSSHLRTMNQLGLLNPVSLIYELMPWSFVVDWFVPVGPVLSALSAPAGLKFISGTTSQRGSITYSGEIAYCPGTVYGRIIEKTASSFSVSDEFYARSVLTGWPIPSPYISLDPFKGDRPWKALALAITSLRGIRNGLR